MTTYYTVVSVYTYCFWMMRKGTANEFVLWYSFFKSRVVFFPIQDSFVVIELWLSSHTILTEVSFPDWRSTISKWVSSLISNEYVFLCCRVWYLWIALIVCPCFFEHLTSLLTLMFGGVNVSECWCCLMNVFVCGWLPFSLSLGQVHWINNGKNVSYIDKMS